LHWRQKGARRAFPRGGPSQGEGQNHCRHALFRSSHGRQVVLPGCIQVQVNSGGKSASVDQRCFPQGHFGLPRGPGTNLQLPGGLVFGPTRRRITTKTLRLKRLCSRCWAQTVMARVVLLVVARSQRRQRRRHSNWAKTRRYELFVLVRIEFSKRAQYKQILIQYKKSILNTFTIYWLVFVCIDLYWFVFESIRSRYWSVLIFSI
jgi:hypothetical protein